jgi:hypothetical protein
MLEEQLWAVGGYCVEDTEISVACPEEGSSSAVGCCHRRQALLSATKIAERRTGHMSGPHYTWRVTN